jgi:hypothetical protein
VAGTPAIMLYGGNVDPSVTTAPAATMECDPIVDPISTTAFVPMNTWSPITIGARSTSG